MRMRKEKEEADSNIAMLMEPCHCDEVNKGSSSKKNSKERMTSGSSV